MSNPRTVASTVVFPLRDVVRFILSRLRSALPAALLAASFVAALAVPAQTTFQGLGQIGRTSSCGRAMSSDGSVIVGLC